MRPAYKHDVRGRAWLPSHVDRQRSEIANGHRDCIYARDVAEAPYSDGCWPFLGYGGRLGESSAARSDGHCHIHATERISVLIFYDECWGNRENGPRGP